MRTFPSMLSLWTLIIKSETALVVSRLFGCVVQCVRHGSALHHQAVGVAVIDRRTANRARAFRCLLESLRFSAVEQPLFLCLCRVFFKAKVFEFAFYNTDERSFLKIVSAWVSGCIFYQMGYSI